MENLDKHYLALGLQRGATQEEIRSAFRQMVKQYHPDKDSSLDAQMKYHEAQQAYAALSKSAESSFTSEPPNAASRSWTSGSSNSTTGGRQQATHNQNFTGFSNPTTGAKKDTANNGGFNGQIRDHPDFKKFFSDFTGMKPEEPKVFSDISLNDYFFRPKLILTVIGSIILIFLAGRYITLMTFTDESSTRLFKHTAVFVFATWVIFWCIRFNHPSQKSAYAAPFILGIAYACWIWFFALWPEFHQFSRVSSSRSIAHVPFVSMGSFIIIFCIAAESLEKESGLRGALSKFFRR